MAMGRNIGNTGSNSGDGGVGVSCNAYGIWLL